MLSQLRKRSLRILPAFYPQTGVSSCKEFAFNCSNLMWLSKMLLSPFCNLLFHFYGFQQMTCLERKIPPFSVLCCDLQLAFMLHEKLSSHRRSLSEKRKIKQANCHQLPNVVNAKKCQQYSLDNKLKIPCPFATLFLKKPT